MFLFLCNNCIRADLSDAPGLTSIDRKSEGDAHGITKV